MPDRSKILSAIAATDDADRLRKFRENAQKNGVDEVADCAFRVLIEIVPSETPGTLEHDFWSMVAAFEEHRRLDQDKKAPMHRTRDEVAQVGIHQTLADFATDPKPTAGFEQLLEWGMPELTGAAIILRHQSEFEPEATAAAKRRLEDASTDIETFARPKGGR
ncbi:hypothetical protein [Notoacmeibacter sp. MSK16QG-6]|uniref:hypothetical protein n=1 Tax=Notoacmeibacter sp. MSK16QG-6 TaxID=2957982 RepID=UPI0020A1E998|nr:hypothetical protein [Notoacmeibacter sp. MSK16QG-6]MCP1200234.1 hypothetical protein [Notoacmeibacter sp. MSK16QG-6]